MIKATIKLEFHSGDNIEKSFEEAIRIASILDVWCEFTFNNIQCLAHKDGSVEKGVKQYLSALENISNEYAIKVAFA